MDCYQLAEPLQQRISCCDHVLFHDPCIECRSMNAFFGWDDRCNRRSDMSPSGESSTKKLSNKNIPQTPNTSYQVLGKDAKDTLPSFRTVKGETVQLLTENHHAAILEDPSCLGARFGPFPVHFAPHFLEKMAAVECGLSLAHVIPVIGNNGFANESVIFVGDIGLLGGGQTYSSSSNSHSCDDYATYKCATCTYTCPNNKCVKCCTHQGHTCEEQKSEKEMETKQRNISDQQQSSMQDIVQVLLNDIHIEEEDTLEVNDLEKEDQSFEILTRGQMEKLNENVYMLGKHSQPQQVAKIGDLPYQYQHNNFSLAVKSPMIIPLWGEVLTKYSLNKNSSHISLYLSKCVEQDNEIFTKLRELDDEQAILNQILNSKSTNKHVSEKFKDIWKNMEIIYVESKDRIQILKQSLMHTGEQSLTSLCDILKAGLEIEEDVLKLIESNEFSVLELRKRWLMERWTNILSTDPEKSNIVEKLANSFWNLDTCLIFQKNTQDEPNAKELLLFLDQVLYFGTPEAVIILVLTSEVTRNDQNGSKIATWMNLIMFQILCNIIHFSHKVIDNIAPHIFKIVQMSFSPTLLSSFIRDHSKQIVANIPVFAEVCKIIHNYRVSNKCCEMVFEHIGKLPITHWKSQTDRKIISYIFPSTDDVTTETLIQKIVQKTSFLGKDDEVKLLSEYTEVTNYYNNQIQDFIKVSELRNHEGLRRPIFSWEAKEIKQWAKLVKEFKIEENILLTIAILQRAMVLHKNWKSLNTVQVLALLLLLQPKRGIGRLAQINTGEGKTVIVAIVAAVHALRGKKVDIITSSRELATKGAEDMRGFFDMLTLTVSHNSQTSGKDSELKNAYKCHILYGITLDFLGDILRKEFRGEDLRCGRKFDTVIVDEFDSLLYDDRMCKVRLTQMMSAMNYLELVLGEIWHFIHFLGQRIIEKDKKTYYIDDHFYLQGEEVILKSESKDKVYVIDDPTNFIIDKTVKHIQKLIETRSSKQLQVFEEYQKLLEEFCKKEETLDEEERKKNEEYQMLRKKLENHPCVKDPTNNYPVLKIPSHLREFAMSQIPIWVENAILAATVYKKNAHYTVKDNQIIPIYFDESGELQMNLVWSDALSQYLQMNEGLPVAAENVSTNFLSHVSFFKRFIPHVCGVTGTAGLEGTKDFLSETFAVDLVVIPPQKHREILDNHNSPCFCKELQPIIVGNEDKWYGYVAAHALHHAKLNRAVLVICRYVFNAEKIIKILSRASKSKIFAYTGISAFKKRELDCGDIVVATNIAGRGTDFIPSFEVERNGGLFVCVTFLPKSFRVGMQNFGRTGRQGRKGMAQYIIYHPQCTNIEDLITKRNEQEEHTCKKAKDNVKKIILEDELFNKFCALQSSLLPSASGIEKEKMYEKLQLKWNEFYFKNSVVLKDRLLFYKDLIKKKIRETRALVHETTVSETNEVEKEEDKVFEELAQYESECKKQIFEKFCFTCDDNYPADIMQCFREGKKYVSNKSILATKFNWGYFERKALEERWGLWLKGKNLESESLEREFDEEFVEQIQRDAKKNELIKNPFIYIQKGNYYLHNAKSFCFRNDEEKKAFLRIAIECYNTAIKLDETFSVQARYNKACALLSHHLNVDKQLEAADELDAALKVIKHTLRPNLSAFLALLSSNKIHEKTMQHIEHQLNIIEQLENSIHKAKEVLAESQFEKHVHVSLVPVKKAFEFYCEDHSAAITEEHANGLSHFFSLELRTTPNWQNVATLSAIGCIQIIFGIGMLCYGQIAGACFIFDGISDLILAVTSIFKGSFSWGKWMAYKAGSLFISLLCAGGRHIISGLKAVGSGLKWIKNAITGAEAASKGGICAVQVIVSHENENCTNLLKTMSENRKIYDNFEKQIFSVIENALTKFISENELIAKALDLEFTKGNEYWSQVFLEKISKLFTRSEFQEKESKLKTLITREMKHSLDSGSVENISKTLRTELELFMSNLLTSFEKDITIYKDNISYLQRSGNEQERVSSSQNAMSSPEVEGSYKSHSEVTSKEQTRNSNGDPSHGARKVELFPGSQSPKEKFTFKFCNSITQRYCSELRKIFLKLDNIPILNLRKNIIIKNEAIAEASREHLKKVVKNIPTSDSQTYDETENSSDQSVLSPDSLKVRQDFDCFEKEECAPIKILHWLPSMLNKPILLFDSHTGRLIDAKGTENAIDPILVKLDHTKLKTLVHHYLPLSDSLVVENKSEGSILNAVWAQLNSEMKTELPLIHLKEYILNLKNCKP